MFLNKKNKKGFTLVELLVSFFIFFLIAGAITNIFVSGIQTQKKILRDQKVLGEISYVMEYMGRSLRMARTDRDGTCINQDRRYELIQGKNDSIRFLSDKDICREYIFDNDVIYERKSTDETQGNLGLKIPLTSSQTEIISIFFNDGGSDWSGSANQSKVTINIKFKSVDDDDDSPLTVQTTVSKRGI